MVVLQLVEWTPSNRLFSFFKWNMQVLSAATNFVLRITVFLNPKSDNSPNVLEQKEEDEAVNP